MTKKKDREFSLREVGDGRDIPLNYPMTFKEKVVYSAFGTGFLLAAFGLTVMNTWTLGFGVILMAVTANAATKF